LSVDKVKPDTSLTVSIGLLAILTDRRALVTLQMSLSARQASCAHPFRLSSRCSSSSIGWCTFRHWAVADGVRAGRRLL
jgi:hypothetical protein